MLILGIDTATPQLGVAIADAESVRASFHLVSGGKHGESLVPAIDFVCRTAKVELKNVTAIAVDVGPGLFTGLRVGLATAKALAFAHGIPTIPVTSVECLAYAAKQRGRTIAAVVDALSDEVYYQIFANDKPATHASLAAPADLAHILGGRDDDVLVVGDGGRRYAERFANLSNVEVAGESLQFPNAATLVDIAREKASRGELTSAADVQILYIRKPYVHHAG
jgi:tRNA threonylcarbamoyladenosine biosynthesis protein TsaB